VVKKEGVGIKKGGFGRKGCGGDLGGCGVWVRERKRGGFDDGNRDDVYDGGE